MKHITSASQETLELIKQAVREVLAEERAKSTITKPAKKPTRRRKFAKGELPSLEETPNEWEYTTPAYYYIGLSSAKKLRQHRSVGDLVKGVDWRDVRVGPGEKSLYEFHIENCKKRLGIDPAKRPPNRNTSKKKNVA
jgi:hypothetical protein